MTDSLLVILKQVQRFRYMLRNLNLNVYLCLSNSIIVALLENRETAVLLDFGR